MPVSNATPLIYLAKLNALDLLPRLFQTVQMPPEVKTEVVDRGKEGGHLDAILLEEALQTGWLRVDSLSKTNRTKAEKLAKIAGIDEGEAQAILLAKQKQERQLLADQTEVRMVAERYGLQPLGTIGILLLAVRRQIVAKDRARALLAKLVESNFHVAARVYERVLTAFSQL